MEKLTQKDDQGNWCLKGVPWKDLYPGSVITRELYEKLYGALQKLMEYEESELDPEDLERLDELYREKCEEIAGLKEELYERN